eukprot:732772-Amphidinium_carterae.1
MLGQVWQVQQVLDRMRSSGWLEAALIHSAIHELERRVETRFQQARLKAWKTWAVEAVSAGASKAHAWSRPKRVSPEVICQGMILVGSKLLHPVQEQWHNIWAVHRGRLPVVPTGADLPSITSAMIYACAMRYPSRKATGVDGISLRVLTYMPEEFLARMAHLLNRWEMTG